MLGFTGEYFIYLVLAAMSVFAAVLAFVSIGDSLIGKRNRVD